MILIYPSVCVEWVPDEEDNRWGVVHHMVGGKEAKHDAGDVHCWCSPVCVLYEEHTEGELNAMSITALH